MKYDYYNQDLVNGGWKFGMKSGDFHLFQHPRDESQFLFEFPQECLVKQLKSEKIFGGYIRASWAVTHLGGMPYVSFSWLPKLAGLVNVDVIGNVYVGDYKSHYGWLTGYGGNMLSGIKRVFTEAFQQISNMSRGTYTHNTDREQWVNDFMSLHYGIVYPEKKEERILYYVGSDYREYGDEEIKQLLKEFLNDC